MRNHTRILFLRARLRAKKIGVPFDLDERAIVVPAVCPVLGIPLSRATGVPDAGSPRWIELFRRWVTSPPNVRVISHRANSLKRDATPEEIRLLYEDSLRLLQPPQERNQ
jgi:hypothetical protein